MALLINTNRIGDLIKWETRREYCRIKLAWTVPGGGVILANPLGYPAIDNGDGTVTLAVLATQANINCLLLSDKPIDAIAAAVIDLTVLRHGPALVNDAIFPAVDTASASFGATAIIDGITPERILAISEAPEIEEQVT